MRPDFAPAPSRPRGLAAAIFLSTCLASLPPSAMAADEVASPAEPARVASLTIGDTREAPAERPSVLSEADADRYVRIFAAQEGADWRAADRLVGELEDKLLLGTVLAHRYQHPHYRTSADELKSWMGAHHGEGEARQIHRIATKGKGIKGIRSPSGGYLIGGGHAMERAHGAPKPPVRKLSGAEKAEAEKLLKKVESFSRVGATKNVKTVLQEGAAKALLSAVDFDRYRTLLATGYFVDGMDDLALEWALPAAQRSGRYIPESHWISGLSLWRQGRFDEAGRQFEAVATVPGQSSWAVAAGAFWAARTHMINNVPEKVNRWLSKAAEYPRTFYGILAARVQGLPLPLDWKVPEPTPERLARLSATGNGRRGLALIQVGQTEAAEHEFRILAAGADEEQRRDIMHLAARHKMGGLAMRLDNVVNGSRGSLDAAAYPLLDWTPPAGSKADKALIFAIIRQESGFHPDARSPAGAMGLMQIMPGTASFIANDRRYGGKNRSDLQDPDLNMYLGQKLIGRLLDEPSIQGDMFALAAAWNGGSGNLDRWVKRGRHQDDPLLFIESIPVRETRDFIEKILTNLWIYRHRLGQPIPELDAIASGERPIYTHLDDNPVAMAENGEN